VSVGRAPISAWLRARAASTSRNAAIWADASRRRSTSAEPNRGLWVPKLKSDLEEDGLVRALQSDVEAQIGGAAGSQEREPPVRLDQRQHRVGGVGLLLPRQVDAGDQAIEQPAGEDRQRQV